MLLDERGTVPAILLAAGCSRRMGKHKLLLMLDGQTVIGRTLDNLLASRASGVTVVLGYQSDLVREAIGERPVEIVLNPDYEQGMSTSLKAGLSAVSAETPYMMIGLADQPFIAGSDYDALISAALASQKGIVLPVYRGQRGNPIILARKYIPELMDMNGDVGGRDLITRYPLDILDVPTSSEGVVININTPEEYRRQLQRLAARGSA